MTNPFKQASPDGSVVAGWRRELWRWLKGFPLFVSSEGVPEAPVARRLRPLTPQYVPEQHQEYVDILVAELSVSGPTAAINLALTGHYGSGKSSVLDEVLRRLQDARVVAIRISLPNLGAIDGRLPSGERAEDDSVATTSNWIQKEIVKQLLYRRSPADMAASRYKRLDDFQVRPARVRAGLVATVCAFVAVLVQLPRAFHDAVPGSFWRSSDQLLPHLSGVVNWSTVPITAWLGYVCSIWLQQVLQQRLKITELAAGPAKISLSDDLNASYFDAFLDEIVYFFQMSKTTVVVFEDLDRFNDPHIFEALRELNMLLNDAAQTGSEPVRFVYAIRDSIFEQKPTASDDPQSDVEVDPAKSNSALLGVFDDYATRALRRQSTNRTKFFDVVVPMVPFISHRTSRDYFGSEMELISDPYRPGQGVIDVVSRHITDMRLIKNICNEYDVFYPKILTDDGLKQLTPDGLFASLAYKNLYLEDYEKILHGHSRLDQLYAQFRRWQSVQVESARLEQRTLARRLATDGALASRSQALGERLQTVLLGRSAHPVTGAALNLSGTEYEWGALTSSAFWTQLVQSRAGVHVTYIPRHETLSLSFEKLEQLMGQTFPAADWESGERAANLSAQADVAERQRALARQRLREALLDVESDIDVDGDSVSLVSIAEDLLGAGTLAMELVRLGYIDENFTLYLSQFSGGATSADAMNFVIKAVQPNLMDIDYTFGGANGPAGDVKSVLDEAPQVLDGRSVYNIEIFDVLLETEPLLLTDPIRRLGKPDPQELMFIKAYLERGKRAEALASALSQHWPGALRAVLDDALAPPRNELVSAVLMGVEPEVEYELGDEGRQRLHDVLPALGVSKSKLSSSRASAIAQVLAQLGIRVADVASIQNPLRSEIIKLDGYEFNLKSLAAITRPGKPSLDVIRELSAENVYMHVLNHLDEYVRQVENGSTRMDTITAPDAFEAVLQDVAFVRPDQVEFIASRANTDCMVRSLSNLEIGVWPALARAQRLELSVDVVMQYTDQYGIDENIAEYLEHVGVVAVPEGEHGPAVLAQRLLATDVLDPRNKLQLVLSLNLAPNSVPAASVPENSRDLIPNLVKAGAVPDEAEAFVAMTGADDKAKQALIRASAALPAYLPTLSLGGEDLWNLVTAGGDEVRDVLLANLPNYVATLGPRAANALTRWIVKARRTVTAPQLSVLAEKVQGSEEGRGAFVVLLGREADGIEISTLLAMLRTLGDPYMSLTLLDMDHSTVPNIPGMDSILERLKREGIVDRYAAKQLRGVISVTKRGL